MNRKASLDGLDTARFINSLVKTREENKQIDINHASYLIRKSDRFLKGGDVSGCKYILKEALKILDTIKE